MQHLQNMHASETKNIKLQFMLSLLFSARGAAHTWRVDRGAYADCRENDGAEPERKNLHSPRIILLRKTRAHHAALSVVRDGRLKWSVRLGAKD